MERVPLRREPIKIGDIFFAKIYAIDCWGTFMNDCGVSDEFLQTDSCYGIGHHFIDNVDIEEDIEFNDDFLFAVKYLGNYIYEEMTTGEKLIANNDWSRYEDYRLDSKDTFKKIRFPVHYDDYVLEEEAERWPIGSDDDFEVTPEMYENNKDRYLDSVKCFKDLSSKYPLTFSHDYVYYIDDESKKEYLKNSDELRRKIIKRMKEMAINERQKIFKILDEEVKKISPDALTSEDLEMAYLENDLYDFEKGKSK